MNKSVMAAIFAVGLAVVGFSLAPIYPGLMTQTPARLGRFSDFAVGFQASAGAILLTGFGFAVALAVICGLPPAIRAMRLQIVDALAGR